MSRALDALKERAARALLWWRSRPARVRRALERRHSRAGGDLPAASRPQPRGDAVLRAAAVQMRLGLWTAAEPFAEKAYDLTRRAVERGARLVVFPEDCPTGLVGLLPGMDRIAGQNLRDAISAMAGPSVKVADIFRFVSPAVWRIYSTTFSWLARRFGVYLVAGSAILPDAAGRMANLAHAYGPDGRLLAVQPKCHFIPMEVEWGLARGDDVELLDTPWARAGFPVCMDATYFETFRILALRGADVVIIPTANPEEYNEWKALRGIWPRVQESRVFGVHSCLVGEFLGLKLTGRSAIYAPMALTEAGDGIVARATSFDAEDVVVADLDLERLRQLRESDPSGARFNLALYENYLPRVYDAVDREVEGGAEV